MAEQTSRLAIIIDSTGAERNADSLASALGKMTQAGEQASNSANKVKKATKEEADALSDLLDRIDPVNAALNKLDKQQRELSKFKAKGMIDTETFDAYSKQIDTTRNRLTGFSDQLNKTGMSAKQTAAAMRMVPAQMTDIVVSLASGQAPLTVLLQQGGQLKDMFGGVVPAAKALGGYVAGLINPFTLAAAAVGVLGLAYYKGSQEQDDFYKSLTLTGNQVDKTSSQLADIAARVSVAANSTTASAASTLNQLVSSGKVAGDSLERVTAAIVKISDATGIATDKLVGDFNDIAADPVAAITKLNEQYHFLTLATYNQIKALQDEGNTQEAARVATDAYANTMQQRSADIQENLGLLEKSWKSLSGAAKDAWDTMLNIGREQTVVDKLATLNENIADAQKRQAEGGVWNRFVANSNAYNLEDMIKKRDALQAQITTEDVLSDAITKHNQAEQKRIKIQQEADRSGQQYLTNSDRRAKAIQQEAKFLEAGAITAEEYAKRLSRINEMYKDPEPPKARKEKAYAEDAATRLLDQINQQTAAMQSQIGASDKLNSATQARVKFEQQISDLKSKTQLTADQQSILARSQEILQAYKNQEALQNSVKTLDDYQKMQEQVKSKDEQTNNLLRERIELLEKARATGKLKPGEYEQTRANIYKNTPVELPSTVKSVIGNLTPTGGELSGTFNGLQNQYGQLDQAQQQLQAWLQAQEDAYAKAGQITADGEARMTAIRQQAAQANQAIEWQKYEIITSATQSIMDSGLQILSDGFGQQSAIYKAAFAASKAYAIAQSMVAINAGIAQAANGPFPANIIAMASVAAQTASIVSNIKAVADAGFMSGGYTGNGATRSISGVVHGQEYVFDAAATKRIGVSNLEAIRNGGLDATLSKPGYGTGAANVSHNATSQNVYNFTGSPISINGNPDDRTILMVKEAQRQGAIEGYQMMVNDLATGKGKGSKALSSGWNTKRRTA